jgi:hypothetical protein
MCVGTPKRHEGLFTEGSADPRSDSIFISCIANWVPNRLTPVFCGTVTVLNVILVFRASIAIGARRSNSVEATEK